MLYRYLSTIIIKEQNVYYQLLQLIKDKFLNVGFNSSPQYDYTGCAIYILLNIIHIFIYCQFFGNVKSRVIRTLRVGGV